MLLTVWQAVCSVGLVPGYMLPSPVEVAAALVKDWPALWENAQITLQEAFYGLALGVAIGFVFAVLAVIGIINAVNGRAKELPLIGKYRLLK